MAKILDINEMMGVILEQNWPGQATFSAALEKIAQDMADFIGERLGIEVGTVDVDCDGAYAAFRPKVAGQACPPAIIHYDPESDWGAAELKASADEEAEAAAEAGMTLEQYRCKHSWVVSEETDRCYCENCGADGDA